ncbi:hypothetical protein F511_41910 [Dorcoceras hygrometricum]|uniref:Uncharacterized protein n=1 Tax=Dorcoceras hygrometricum TaxID=472368 RepID=A0A2Z7CFG1_9LAMI|nr:hypothetical protein F511_41910 [Dorcoceras hygrometricum]
MGLPLLYKPVVSEFKDVREASFDLETDEVVTVYASVCLWTQLVTPSSLNDFMKCIKELDPSLMVVNEYEACTDTLNFIDRFYGSLIYAMTVFDCLENCLKGDPLYWKIIEEFLRGVIRNIITAEDEERIYWHAKIDFWRNLFAEFDMMEMELSDVCKYQAKLLLKSNSSWNNCTLDMEGKCLIVGWKGTPLQSISAWKINQIGNSEQQDDSPTVKS